MRGTIIGVYSRELHVRTSQGRGRVHATSVDGDHMSAPFVEKLYKQNQAIEAAVLGTSPRGYLELSLKEFDLRTARESQTVARTIPNFEDLVVGDKLLAVCAARLKRRIIAELSPKGLRGSIDWLDTTDDLGLLNTFNECDELSEGRLLHCRVIALDHTRQKIKLSCTKRRPAENRIRNNALLPAKIESRERGRGVHVEASGGVEGYVHITELSDRFVSNPLKRVPTSGRVVLVRVLDSASDPVRMSLRPSLGASGVVVAENEGVDPQRFESLDEIKVQQHNWTPTLSSFSCVELILLV